MLSPSIFQTDTYLSEKDVQLNILLIDDDENSYILLKHLLAETNITSSGLDWVSTYRAGLEAIVKRQHDIYLIDYRLDSYNGLDLLRQAAKDGCRAPLILLTGHDLPDLWMKAFEFGASDYLLKNEIEPQLLERSIRYAIERKRAEQSKRGSEAELRQVFDLIPHIITAKDSKGNFVLLNKAAADMYGRTVEALVGRNISSVYHEQTEAEHALAEDQQIMRTGRTKKLPPENFTDTQGNEHVLQTTKTPFTLLNRRERAVLETKIDITEFKNFQKEQEQAYKALENRLGERANELAEAQVQLKEEMSERQRLAQRVDESLSRHARQVQTSTQIAQEIANAPRLDDLFRNVVNLVQQQFGYYHAHLYIIEGDYLVIKEGTGSATQMMKASGYKIQLATRKSLIARAAQTGEPVLITDVTKDPGWLPNRLLPNTKSELAVPVKLGDNVLGVLDVQNDTVNSLDQEDLILLMGLCGQIAVAIKNRRLDDKRKVAEDDQQRLIEELDAFAHAIGHALRDPTSMIAGYTDLLKAQASLSDELQEYLNAIARNSRKVGHIIDELQILTGVRTTEVTPRPLNMVSIIAEVQQRLAYLIQESQAKIIVSEYWPVALGHKPWIEEVWANYLSNAIKFGGTPPMVQLGSTLQSDGKVRFWIRDNGPGFTDEEMGLMFQEFGNLSDGRVTEYSLGLSIVKRIITKLGGDVAVEHDNISGQGTIFSFTLPQANNVRKNNKTFDFDF